MAMLAAPQPSWGCSMKGTSIQRPPGCALATVADRHKTTASFAMDLTSVGDHNDQDEYNYAEDDQCNVARAQVSGGKIALGLVGPR